MLIFPEYLVPHQIVKGMISGSTANIEAVLEEFAAGNKAIYLSQKDGKVYAFVPLSGNPSSLEINKIGITPKRIISNVDGRTGLFIYPPGADVVALSGVTAEEVEDAGKMEKSEDLSLEDFLPQLENAISYLLVDFSEFASKVQVSFEKNKVLLRAKNIKLDVEAPRFTKVLGSPPVSLAACCMAQITKMPVKVTQEKEEGRWLEAAFEVGERISG